MKNRNIRVKEEGRERERKKCEVTFENVKSPNVGLSSLSFSLCVGDRQLVSACTSVGVRYRWGCEKEYSILRERAFDHVCVTTAH